MRMDSLHPKITPQHLDRKALVYLRQSSLKQVKDNLESQHLQYALAERARALGFRTVEVIDSDLGCSAGLGAARRAGFDHVVAAVARGEVGVILSREASRLSRTDRDWCHLLEVCQIFGTLLADEEQIYDLSLLDDQLILGIKGTLSVVELKVLKCGCSRGGKIRPSEENWSFGCPPVTSGMRPEKLFWTPMSGCDPPSLWCFEFSMRRGAYGRLSNGSKTRRWSCRSGRRAKGVSD